MEQIWQKLAIMAQFSQKTGFQWHNFVFYKQLCCNRDKYFNYLNNVGHRRETAVRQA